MVVATAGMHAPDNGTTSHVILDVQLESCNDVQFIAVLAISGCAGNEGLRMLSLWIVVLTTSMVSHCSMLM
jgi:hypothetical protein